MPWQSDPNNFLQYHQSDVVQSLDPDRVLKYYEHLVDHERVLTSQDIDALLSVIDINTCPADKLIFLSALIGLELDPRDNEDQQRDALRYAVAWYREKGKMSSFTLLFSSMKLAASVVPLWINETGDVSPEQSGPNYKPHARVDLVIDSLVGWRDDLPDKMQYILDRMEEVRPIHVLLRKTSPNLSLIDPYPTVSMAEAFRIYRYPKDVPIPDCPGGGDPPCPPDDPDPPDGPVETGDGYYVAVWTYELDCQSKQWVVTGPVVSDATTRPNSGFSGSGKNWKYTMVRAYVGEPDIASQHWTRPTSKPPVNIDALCAGIEESGYYVAVWRYALNCSTKTWTSDTAPTVTTSGILPVLGWNGAGTDWTYTTAKSFKGTPNIPGQTWTKPTDLPPANPDIVCGPPIVSGYQVAKWSYTLDCALRVWNSPVSPVVTESTTLPVTGWSGNNHNWTYTAARQHVGTSIPTGPWTKPNELPPADIDATCRGIETSGYYVARWTVTLNCDTKAWTFSSPTTGTEVDLPVTGWRGSHKTWTYTEARGYTGTPNLAGQTWTTPTVLPPLNVDAECEGTLYHGYYSATWNYTLDCNTLQWTSSASPTTADTETMPPTGWRGDAKLWTYTVVREYRGFPNLAGQTWTKTTELPPVDPQDTCNTVPEGTGYYFAKWDYALNCNTLLWTRTGPATGTMAIVPSTGWSGSGLSWSYTKAKQYTGTPNVNNQVWTPTAELPPVIPALVCEGGTEDGYYVGVWNYTLDCAGKKWNSTTVPAVTTTTSLPTTGWRGQGKNWTYTQAFAYKGDPGAVLPAWIKPVDVPPIDIDVACSDGPGDCEYTFTFPSVILCGVAFDVTLGGQYAGETVDTPVALSIGLIPESVEDSELRLETLTPNPVIFIGGQATVRLRVSGCTAGHRHSARIRVMGSDGCEVTSQAFSFEMGSKWRVETWRVVRDCNDYDWEWAVGTDSNPNPAVTFEYEKPRNTEVWIIDPSDDCKATYRKSVVIE